LNVTTVGVAAAVGVGVGVGLGVGGGCSITKRGDGVGRVVSNVYRGEAMTAMLPATSTSSVTTKRTMVRLAMADCGF
jgi:hypothetical protein